MPRSTNAPAARRRRKRVLQQAKGYWGCRKNVYSIAKNAVDRAHLYAYRDRRNRKRSFRRLWIQRINAGARALGTSYHQLLNGLSQKNIHLNRKVLADLAMHHPTLFQKVASLAK